ncbi:MAG: hypothetical protein LUI39_07620 [Lachnospiraceae bacterium]|nr:hypothetical protein [Lachnospiraceae bacterium]
MRDYLNRKAYKDMIYYLAAILISSAAVYFAYHLWNVDLRKYPLSYSGDGLNDLVRTKRLLQGGGFAYTSDLVGAPFGASEYDLNQNNYLPVLVKMVLSLFTSNYILVYNLANLSGYVIIACASLYILVKLGVEKKVAVVLAVLYACSPYHFLRAFNHYALGYYLAVPVAVYYIVSMMQGSVLDNKRHYVNWNNLKFLLAMIIVGSCGVYYAFFACFFLCVAGIYILINERNLKRLLEPGISLVFVFGTTVAGYLPTMIYNRLNGENTAALIRQIDDTQTYSLRISQLVLPITNHRISFLAALKSAYNSAFSSNENDSSTLGLVFLVGFVILLLYFWRKRNKEEEIPHLQELASLNLAALIYGSSGGLILIQGLFTSMIRCTNRISIYISFFSCICVGICLSRRIQKKNLRQGLVAAGAAVILIVGVYDQTATAYINYDSLKSAVDSDKAFIEEIESMEAEGSMILQLPIVSYPEAGTVNSMADYSHFIGYLFSDTLKWSYGIVKGRTGSDFYSALKSSDTSAEKIIETAAAMGYTGIYIDTAGYTADEASELREQMTALLGEEPIVSANEDKLYFSLTEYIEENEIEVAWCNFVFTEGIYSKEKSGDSSYRWMEDEGQLEIYSWSEEAREVSLILTIGSPWEEEYSLTLSMEDSEAVYNIEKGSNTCVFDVVLQPGYNTITFSTDAPAKSTETDSRNRHLKLKGYSVE